MTYVVYKPTAPPKHGSEHLAVRPSSLGGKTIGLLWNAKVNADVYLQRVHELLQERNPDARFVNASKPTASRPMDRDVFETLRTCDVVVNAFGD